LERGYQAIIGPCGWIYLSLFCSTDNHFPVKFEARQLMCVDPQVITKYNELFWTKIQEQNVSFFHKDVQKRASTECMAKAHSQPTLYV